MQLGAPSPPLAVHKLRPKPAVRVASYPAKVAVESLRGYKAIMKGSSSKYRSNTRTVTQEMSGIAMVFGNQWHNWVPCTVQIKVILCYIISEWSLKSLESGLSVVAECRCQSVGATVPCTYTAQQAHIAICSCIIWLSLWVSYLYASIVASSWHISTV